MLKTKLLVKNSLFSFGGKVGSVLAALVGIPIIIKHAGTEQFGLLSILWISIGYLAVFDLGIGRTITQFVSNQLGKNSLEDVGPYIGSAILITLFAGIGVGGLVLFISPYICRNLFNIPPDLLESSITSFNLLGVIVPFILVSQVLRGALEAFQQFKKTAFLAASVSAGTYLSIAAVAYFYQNFILLIVALCAFKVVNALTLYYLLQKEISSSSIKIRYSVKQIPELLKFGQWVTVSNIISPLMGNLDRFIIGSVITMSAVAYYTTAFDMVSKVNIIPTSLASVMFPAFSAVYQSNQLQTRKLYRQSLLLLQWLMLPAVCGLILFSYEILLLWLNKEFAENSSLILQILGVGIFFSNLAQISFSFLQAAGHPQITAKIHAIELPLFLIILWILINHFGIIGAALASTIRIISDQLFLMIFADKIMGKKIEVITFFGLPLTVLLSTFMLVHFVPDLWIRAIIFGFSTLLFYLIVWKWFLNNKHKEVMGSLLNRGS